jgi:hypothetical protein
MAMHDRYVAPFLLFALAIALVGLDELVRRAPSQWSARGVLVALLAAFCFPLLANHLGVVRGSVAMCGLATFGMVAMVPRSATRIGAGIAVVVSAVAIGPMIDGWHTFVEARIELPTEDFRGPSSVLAAAEPAVLIATNDPYGLEFYGRRPDYVIGKPLPAGRPRKSEQDTPVVVPLRTVSQLVCSTQQTVVLMLYEDDLNEFPKDCLQERGATLSSFHMRTRGGRVDVWVLDPAA